MFLALREMKHAKMRYFLIGLIMVLILFLVLFVSGLAKGLSSDNASAVQKLNTDYLILQEGSENRLNRSVLLKDTLHDVNQYLDSQASAPLGVQMTTITNDESSKKVDITFFAINVDDMLAPDVVEGKMISNLTPNEVVVNISLKEEGFNLGDQFNDPASKQAFKIVGFTENQSFSHTPVIHINFNEWAALQHSNDQNEIFFNAIALKTTQDNAKQLDENILGIDLISKDQALKGIPGYQEEQGSLTMMITFLFIIATFVLAVFFYVITIQKINQFGVLKAIGAKSGYLARTIVSQVLLLTIVSLIISITLTYGVAFILPNSLPFELSFQLVLGSSLLFLAVSVVGSLISLYRVAKIDAIEAIGRAF